MTWESTKEGLDPSEPAGEEELKNTIRSLISCLQATELAWRRRYNTVSCSGVLSRNSATIEWAHRVLEKPPCPPKKTESSKRR